MFFILICTFSASQGEISDGLYHIFIRQPQTGRSCFLNVQFSSDPSHSFNCTNFPQLFRFKQNQLSAHFASSFLQIFQDSGGVQSQERIIFFAASQIGHFIQLASKHGQDICWPELVDSILHWRCSQTSEGLQQQWLIVHPFTTEAKTFSRRLLSNDTLHSTTTEPGSDRPLGSGLVNEEIILILCIIVFGLVLMLIFCACMVMRERESQQPSNANALESITLPTKRTQHFTTPPPLVPCHDPKSNSIVWKQSSSPYYAVRGSNSHFSSLSSTIHEWIFPKRTGTSSIGTHEQGSDVPSSSISFAEVEDLNSELSSLGLGELQTTTTATYVVNKFISKWKSEHYIQVNPEEHGEAALDLLGWDIPNVQLNDIGGESTYKARKSSENTETGFNITAFESGSGVEKKSTRSDSSAVGELSMIRVNTQKSMPSMDTIYESSSKRMPNGDMPSPVSGISKSQKRFPRATTFEFARQQNFDHWIFDNDIESFEDAAVASGNFGSIYVGQYQGCPCAFKLMEDTVHWIKEGDLFFQISLHPCICRFYGIYRNQDQQNYLVMDYFKDGSVQDVLKYRAFSRREKLHICDCIAKGIWHIHAKGVIHADLALRNCLIDIASQPMRVVITDFGLSRRATSNFPAKILSPRWSSPALLHTKIPTFASDVWAMGVTFWELFSLAEKPYSDLSTREVIQGLLTRQISLPVEESWGLADVLSSIFSNSEITAKTVHEQIMHKLVKEV